MDVMWWKSTPPKTNMEPENYHFEKENHLPNLHFGVPAVSFRGCRLDCLGLTRCDSKHLVLASSFHVIFLSTLYCFFHVLSAKNRGYHVQHSIQLVKSTYLNKDDGSLQRVFSPKLIGAFGWPHLLEIFLVGRNLLS